MGKWILLAVLFVLAAFLPGYASAQTICTPRYGGGANCDKNTTVVDKKVKNPRTTEYLNTLDTKGPFYTPGQTVSFRITVTNIGTAALTNVTLIDNFPKYLTHTRGGTWDNEKRQVRFPISRLNVNETRTFDIEARISDEGSITETASLFCLSNTASTTIQEQTFQDTAQFCLENKKEGQVVPNQTKGGLPVFSTPQNTPPTQTPKTGAETLLLLPLLGGMGYLLRRNTN